MDSRIKQLAEQAGWMMGDGPEGFNTRLERFAALITEEAADEIERLRKDKAELLEEINKLKQAKEINKYDTHYPDDGFGGYPSVYNRR